MPAPRKLPPADELHELVRRGQSHRDIADQFGVTRQAVGDRLAKAGLQAPVVSYADEIPWRVKAVHNNHVLLRMLRMYARHKRGMELRPDQLARLDQWLKHMRDEDAVVEYRANTPEGFGYAKRKPGDLELIRPPAPGEGRV